MKRRRVPSFLCVVVALTLSAGLPACSMMPFHHHEEPAPATATVQAGSPGLIGARPNARGLTVEIKTSPDPLKLGETREINVTMVVRNNSKVATTLKFGTSQLIELLLRDPDSGKVVSQWSTEHSFSAEGRYLVINPKERLEYNEPITTRELHAGKAYTLEGYFVGYDQDLRATKAILPQP